MFSGSSILELGYINWICLILPYIQKQSLNKLSSIISSAYIISFLQVVYGAGGGALRNSICEGSRREDRVVEEAVQLLDAFRTVVSAIPMNSSGPGMDL